MPTQVAVRETVPRRICAAGIAARLAARQPRQRAEHRRWRATAFRCIRCLAKASRSRLSALSTSFGFHVRLRRRNVLPRQGFARDWNEEKIHDENESPRRRRCSFRGHRRPGVRSGRWRIRFGTPKGLGAAAVAASLPRLRARPRIRAALPGAALRLERRQGPIERGRHRAIAAAFGELVFLRRNAENENRPPLREDVC